MSKLIIIRGNSGSGKSTIAKAVRERINEKTALVEQDYLRRSVLGVTGKSGDDIIMLIDQVVRFSLDRGYVTILEGILPKEYYGEMLLRLVNYADKSYVFYLDIPIEETLVRHQTKPNSHEFGETEIRDWFRDKDYLGIENEVIIDSSSTIQNSVETTLSNLGVPTIKSRAC